MITRTTAAATTAPWHRTATITAGLLLLAAAPARAQWSVTPYVWAAGLHVDASAAGRTVVDEQVAFSDLAKDVTLAAMVRVDVQHRALGGKADLFYVRLESTGNAVTLRDGTEALLDERVGMAVLDLTGSVAFRDDGRGLALVAGTRVLVEDAEVDLVVPAGDGTTTRRAETNDLLVNAIVGVRYRARLASRWAAELRADVGAGETELTWSVGSEMAFAISSRVALSIGYRHFVVEFEDDAVVESRMAMSGLVTGVRIGL